MRPRLPGSGFDDFSEVQTPYAKMHGPDAPVTDWRWLDYQDVLRRGHLVGPADPSTSGDSASKREAQVTAANGAIRVAVGEPPDLGAQIFDVITYAGDLYIFAGICAGPIDSVVSYTFNRKDPAVAGTRQESDGTQTPIPIAHTIEHHTGALDQAGTTLAAAALLARDGFVQTYPGLAYSVIKFPKGGTGFDGIPEIRFRIRARLVLDPRTNILASSESWTLGGFVDDVWFASLGSPVVTLAQANLWGGMTAAKLDFSGGHATIAQRCSAGTTTNAWGFSFAAKLLSGAGTGTLIIHLERAASPILVALNEEITNVTLTDKWQWFDVTHSGAGTYPVRVRIESTGGAIFLIDKAHVYDADTDAHASYGYRKTSGTARTLADTATAAWSHNPFIIARALAMDAIDGPGLASSEIDHEAFGRAACLAEVQRDGYDRFSLDASFETRQPFPQWLDLVRLSCQGYFFRDQGKLSVWCDVEQEAVAVSFVEDSNCEDVRHWREDTVDSPSKVTVFFPSTTSGKTDKAEAATSGVEDGTEDLREAEYQDAPFTAYRYAYRAAYYMEKWAEVDRRASLIASPLAELAKPGSLVEVTSKNGLNATQFLVLTNDREADGIKHSVTARAYDATIYADTTPDTSGDTGGGGTGTGGVDMSYLDAWLGFIGSTYPYNGAAPADRTVSGNETWNSADDLAFGFRRYKKLTIAAGVVITIPVSPFILCVDELAFGDTASQLKADGQAGGASVTFAATQARGGLATGATARGQGGCGGGILLVIANTVSGAAGLITARGGAAYASWTSGTPNASQGGQGAMSRRLDAGGAAPAPVEDWTGETTTTSAAAAGPLLWHRIFGTGGQGDSSTVLPRAGGSGGHNTTTQDAAGGSGLAGGAGTAGAGGTPLVAPTLGQILELLRLGCFGGGGGAAGIASGQVSAGGGGGGAAALFAKTLSVTPTLSATGGAGASANGGSAQNGADGYTYTQVW